MEFQGRKGFFPAFFMRLPEALFGAEKGMGAELLGAYRLFLCYTGSALPTCTAA